MADEEGVIPADSPAEPELTQDATAQAAVTADRVERPVENLAAEMNRKFGRFERQMNDLIQMVATQRQPQPQPQQQDVTDDDLWRLAQQGDRNAFDIYMERKAARVSEGRIQSAQSARLVEAQLGALNAKYPVLSDPTHPLTQTVHQAYSLLVQQGEPANRKTLLDAVKTAIADKDDIVSDLRAQRTGAYGAMRASAATRAQAGVTGATHRESQTPVRGTKVSSDQVALAQRMGVKDPAKAFERFKQRRAQGISNVGLVGGQLDDAEIGGA